MANTTANSDPVIRAQVYSDFILENILDGFLPEGLHRDVSDFGDGETLFIPRIGETVIRDYVEDTPAKYDPVDTGQVQLVINQYKQGGSYITRKLRQDSYAVRAIEAQIPVDHLRKIKEAYETDLLAQVNQQTTADPNTINGFDHRWVADSTATTGIISLEDFLYMKASFDKANVPDEGRIVIVDPVAEASLNKEVAGEAFTNNPQFEGLVGEGFSRGRKFVRNIFGWDVWVSNRLPRIADETINGGPQAASTQITGGVANIFMSVLDDQHKPFMGAWRQMPQTDGEFNKDFQRDEFLTTARWGFGLQRDETVGAVLTSATAYK